MFLICFILNFGCYPFVIDNIGELVPLIHAVGYFIAVEWYRSNYRSLTLLLSSVCSGGMSPY